MTTFDAHDAGTVCWVELSTTDLTGAKAFYVPLFGWQDAVFPTGDGGDYLVFALADGRTAAGAYEQQEQERSMGVPPHWNLHIRSDDVDKDAARAVQAGGTVVVPAMDTPNGRLAVLADPTGATFSLWQSDTMPGFTVRDDPGSFSWAELITNDTERAARFYADVFGWTAKAEPMGDAPPYTVFRLEDRPIGGLFPPPMPEIPNSWTVYLEVADADAAVAKVAELGGRVLHGPMTVPGAGTFATVADPAGAVFAIIKSE